LGISFQVDPVASAISAVSLAVSIAAIAVARGGHSKLVRREEFATFRERVSRARLDLMELTKQLDRLADGTVPLEGVVVGFDAAYPGVDAALRALQDVCAEIDESQLFGGNWLAPVEQHASEWAVEFDCVQCAQRPEHERMAAASRAVATLNQTSETLKERVWGVVKDHT
jgi:hypothetical protein